MISIITPTYNRAHLLPRMINSVLNQTFEDWELIIMDDGSTDLTKQVIESYNCKKIKYFYTENSGAGDKRNQGVTKSSGEFLIFLDSDDEVKPTWLENLVNELNRIDASVVSCGLDKYDENGNLIETVLNYKYSELFGGFKGLFLSGTFIFKKHVFNDIGGYDISLPSGQHTDLTLRLIPYIRLKQMTYSHLNLSLIKIHVHVGSKIRNNPQLIYDGTVAIINKHKKLFLENKIDYFNYLNIAGINAVKLNKINEGKLLFKEAFSIQPLNVKAIFRYLIIYVPFLPKLIWK